MTSADFQLWLPMDATLMFDAIQTGEQSYKKHVSKEKYLGSSS